MTRVRLCRELVRRLLRIERPHPVRVAVDGIDGAGKTSLAEELGDHVRHLDRKVIRTSIDGFHRPKAYRYRKGRASPAGYYHDSFDYWRLRDLLLEPLGPGGSLKYRTAVFDHRTDGAVQQDDQQADPTSILLFDGVFLLRPELADCWDYRIFVDVDFDVSVERATRRDIEAGGDPEELERLYEKRYVAGHRLYLAQCNPQNLADVVVINNDVADPVLQPKST